VSRTCVLVLSALSALASPALASTGTVHGVYCDTDGSQTISPGDVPNWALAPSSGGPCDVVSLSHGGLPSNAWARAVNDLYDAGIVVVAASGDSFNLKVVDLATHFTVYPSAFHRVGEMQGCWGPMR